MSHATHLKDDSQNYDFRLKKIYIYSGLRLIKKQILRTSRYTEKNLLSSVYPTESSLWITERKMQRLLQFRPQRRDDSLKDCTSHLDLPDDH